MWQKAKHQFSVPLTGRQQAAAAAAAEDAVYLYVCVFVGWRLVEHESAL